MAKDKEYTEDELTEWFKTKSRAVASSTARRILLSTERRKRDDDAAFVGKLYFFRYDPKHKATLPQYDKFPLAFILDLKEDGFLGLNLHYLPKGQRAAMLQIFSKYRQEYRLKQSVSPGRSSNWENLMNFTDGGGMTALPKRCLKLYLWGRVASHFVEIYPEEYNYAVQLPVEDWVFKR